MTWGHLINLLLPWLPLQQNGVSTSIYSYIPLIYAKHSETPLSADKITILQIQHPQFLLLALCLCLTHTVSTPDSAFTQGLRGILSQVCLHSPMIFLPCETTAFGCIFISELNYKLRGSSVELSTCLIFHKYRRLCLYN